ncbi:MAG: hypothetical protein NC182_01765 [Prevotella sp.]|nr:hypothetical protein [Staphylococcus sp.]MCM1349910.1 hypothetical protein [Prevotella sp.]
MKNKRLIFIITAILGSFFLVSCNCASCERWRKDCSSELNNGTDRIVRIYNYQGELIAEYEGKIDIEDNSGSYCLFHVNGKRYMYYNAIVEVIEK